jgi:hypothetical protein
LINASKSVENILGSFERRSERRPPESFAVAAVTVRRWVAHTAALNSLTRIAEPLCYVSSSLDKHLRFWKIDGERLSQINLAKLDKNQEWYFPFNWVGQKLNDI